jgi:hypothetical protein
MLTEQDLAAIRTRIDREWREAQHTQAKRKGKAAVNMNLADVKMLLAAYEEKEREASHWAKQYGLVANEREAAVADAARSLAAMREARTERAEALDRVEAAAEILSCRLFWPLHLLWPKFGRVLASLRNEKEERP